MPVWPFEQLLPAWLPVDEVVPVWAFELPPLVWVEVGVGVGAGVGVGQVVVDVLVV